MGLWLEGGRASRNSQVLAEAGGDSIKECHLERALSGSEPLYENARVLKYVQTENPRYIKQRLIDKRGTEKQKPPICKADVKNGVGGLRDYQNILWMAHIKFGYESLGDSEARLLRRDERVAMGGRMIFFEGTDGTAPAKNAQQTSSAGTRRSSPGFELSAGYFRGEGVHDGLLSCGTYNLPHQRTSEGAFVSASSGEGSRYFSAMLYAPKSGMSESTALFCGTESSARSRKIFKESPVRLIRIFRYMQQFGAKMDSDLKFLVSRSIPLIDEFDSECFGREDFVVFYGVR